MITTERLEEEINKELKKKQLPKICGLQLVKPEPGKLFRAEFLAISDPKKLSRKDADGIKNVVARAIVRHLVEVVLQRRQAKKPRS